MKPGLVHSTPVVRFSIETEEEGGEGPERTRAQTRSSKASAAATASLAKATDATAANHLLAGKELELASIFRRMKPRSAEEKHFDDILFSSSEDDEKESLAQQRLAYKSFLAGTLHPSATLHEGGSNNASQTSDSGSLSASLEQAFHPQRSQCITILIEDFSFSSPLISAMVGDIIVFKLADSTPGHAEHVLNGDSHTSELCFQSPVLSSKGCKSYSFCLRKAGELVICCLIYSDMACTVKVKDRTHLSALSVPPAASSSIPRDADQDDSQIVDDYGSHDDQRSGVNNCGHNGLRSSSSSSSSFYDSDDLISSESEHSTPVSIDEMTDPGPSWMNQSDCTKGESEGSVYKVILAAFAFKPNQIVCQCGDRVQFEFARTRDDSNVEGELECEGEFAPTPLRILPSSRMPAMEHVFRTEGIFYVRHCGLTFMTCRVVVRPRRTPITNSPNSVAKTISKPIFYVPRTDLPTTTAQQAFSDSDEADDDSSVERRERSVLRSTLRSQSQSRSPSEKANSPTSKVDFQERKPMSLFGSFVSLQPRNLAQTNELIERTADLAVDLGSDSEASSSSVHEPPLRSLPSPSKEQQSSQPSPPCENDPLVAQPAAPVLSRTAKKRRNQRLKKILEKDQVSPLAQPQEPIAETRKKGMETSERDRGEVEGKQGAEAASSLPSLHGRAANNVAAVDLPDPASSSSLPPITSLRAEEIDVEVLQAALSAGLAEEVQGMYGLALPPSEAEFTPVVKKRSKLIHEKPAVGADNERGRTEGTPLAESSAKSRTESKKKLPKPDKPSKASRRTSEAGAAVEPVVPAKPPEKAAHPSSETPLPPLPSDYSVSIVAADLSATSTASIVADDRVPSQSNLSSEMLAPAVEPSGDEVTTAPHPASEATSQNDSPQQLPQSSPADLPSPPTEKRKALLMVLGLKNLAVQAPQSWGATGVQSSGHYSSLIIAPASVSPETSASSSPPEPQEEETESSPQAHDKDNGMDCFDEDDPNEAFFLKRYCDVLALLEKGEEDQLPSGRRVPVVRWREKQVPVEELPQSNTEQVENSRKHRHRGKGRSEKNHGRRRGKSLSDK